MPWWLTSIWMPSLKLPKTHKYSVRKPRDLHKKMLLFSWDCYFYDLMFCHWFQLPLRCITVSFSVFHHRSSWEKRIITDNVGNEERRWVHNFASSPGLWRGDIWLFGTSSSTNIRNNGNTSTENIFDGYFSATCKVSTLYCNTAEIVILWVGSFFHYFSHTWNQH